VTILLRIWTILVSRNARSLKSSRYVILVPHLRIFTVKITKRLGLLLWSLSFPSLKERILLRWPLLWTVTILLRIWTFLVSRNASSIKSSRYVILIPHLMIFTLKITTRRCLQIFGLGFSLLKERIFHKWLLLWTGTIPLRIWTILVLRNASSKKTSRYVILIPHCRTFTKKVTTRNCPLTWSLGLPILRERICLKATASCPLWTRIWSILDLRRILVRSEAFLRHHQMTAIRYHYGIRRTILLRSRFPPSRHSQNL